MDMLERIFPSAQADEPWSSVDSANLWVGIDLAEQPSYCVVAFHEDNNVARITTLK